MESHDKLDAELKVLERVGIDHGTSQLENLRYQPQEYLEAVGPFVNDFPKLADKPLIRVLVAESRQVMLNRLNAHSDAVDTHLTHLLDACVLGDASLIPLSLQAFKEIVEIEVPKAKGDLFSIDAYNDHLRWRMGTMPSDRLNAMTVTAAELEETSDDPVVARLAFASLSEHVRRQIGELSEQGDEPDLASLTLEHTRALRTFAAHLIETAQKFASDAAATDPIPGAALTKGQLQRFHDGLERQLAFGIAWEAGSKDVALMTDAERGETAWAARYCKEKNVSIPKTLGLGRHDVTQAMRNAWPTRLDILEARLKALG